MIAEILVLHVLCNRFGYEYFTADLPILALFRFAALVAVERSFPSKAGEVYKGFETSPEASIFAFSEGVYTYVPTCLSISV